MKNKRLRSMLEASATADRERALLSLELLSDHPAGIGDHSTKDFYANAEEALALLADADDRLEMLAKYFPRVSTESNGKTESKSKSKVERITR
jgi:hypothetical protein